MYHEYNVELVWLLSHLSVALFGPSFIHVLRPFVNLSEMLYQTGSLQTKHYVNNIHASTKQQSTYLSYEAFIALVQQHNHPFMYRKHIISLD